MRFGSFPLAAAEGLVLAHTFRHETATLRKGHVLTADDIAVLAKAGVTEIIAARLDPTDVNEDAAAARVARCLVAPGLKLTDARTGRCNLEATADGVVLIDGDAITAANLADESVTIATLADKAAVRKGQIVATVKIIPFAVASDVLTLVEGALAAPALALKPYVARRFALISTILPTLKPSVVANTEDLTTQRVDICGGKIVRRVRCAHTASAVAAEVRAAVKDGAEIVLIASASATVDRADNVPAGVVAAGGVIDHFGMPVDPGIFLCWRM